MGDVFGLSAVVLMPVILPDSPRKTPPIRHLPNPRNLLETGASRSYRRFIRNTRIQPREDNMAKTKGKPSKSALIRDALAAAPEKPATEIAKEVGVSVALVYNVKASMKKKAGKPKGKPGRKVGSKVAAKATAPVAAHEALDTAFDFVTKVGGLLHAEQLIAKLRSIKDKL